MNKTKISKKKAIEIILSEYEKGNLSFGSVLGVIESKWQIAESTFARYWKETKKAYDARQKTIQAAKDEVSIEEAKKAQKNAVLTRIERMEIATKIGRGEARKIGDQIIIPSDGDRLRALDYLSKIEGDYSPELIQVTEIKPLEFRIIQSDDGPA